MLDAASWLGLGCVVVNLLVHPEFLLFGEVAVAGLPHARPPYALFVSLHKAPPGHPPSARDDKAEDSSRKRSDFHLDLETEPQGELLNPWNGQGPPVQAE